MLEFINTVIDYFNGNIPCICRTEIHKHEVQEIHSLLFQLKKSGK